MLPVYVVHDEYLFIRVLQSFEAIFALIGVLLRSAACALANGEHALAARRIRHAESAQCESAPLFSLLATMQVESFRIFRRYTEGASAIQSRHYKTVESLCRRPEGARLHSVAYRSVPEVRDRVLAGEATLDDEFAAAVALGRLTGTQRDDLARAMRQFEAAHLGWRQTHYRLAVRMLGERPGTGYTEGTPYLAAVRSIPVFRSCYDASGQASSSEECAFHAFV
jgi:tryptophan 2,3-dioxygenase